MMSLCVGSCAESHSVHLIATGAARCKLDEVEAGARRLLRRLRDPQRFRRDYTGREGPERRTFIGSSRQCRIEQNCGAFLS